MEKTEEILKHDCTLAKKMKELGFSDNACKKLFKNKDIKVDGKRVKEDKELKAGQFLEVFFDKLLIKKDYEIIYQDDNIFCINKFKGIEVEGCQGLEGKVKGSIPVHRLDRNTEGLLIMAKNENAKNELSKAFKDQRIRKKYLAEVVGRTDFDGKVYKAYLLKDSKTSFVKIFNTPRNQTVEIRSAFRTLKSNACSSLVECEIYTGKTHQIRAHLAFLGHHIIGDGKYGKNEINKKFKEKSQKLHCFYLKIEGLTGELIYLNGKEFFSPPNWLEQSMIELLNINH